MQIADEKLKNIRNQIRKGVAPPRERVRWFLLWFGAERRGWHVVRRIRSKLDQYGLITIPDFEYAFIDGYISFSNAEGQASSTNSGTAVPDPTYRIGRLASANSPPVSVKPDSTLQQAVTVMLTSDFSQLPVMTTERDVRGVMSWKTIGSRLALKKECKVVRDCMEPAHDVSIEDSLFSAISAIADYDYVLVRAIDKKICGIITASDFNEQFRKLAEPFLLVGEIEKGVRRILHGKFTAAELDAVKAPEDDGRQIEGVADLTFGEYARLIEEEKRWKKLRLEIDRVEFVSRLHKVREIRNDVMHFDPDGLEEADLDTLREFAQFLKRLRDVGVV
jgi:CBS domain-containing protein